MRYFFHIRDGTTSVDEVGIELPHFGQVKSEALRFTGELLAQAGEEFWDCSDWMLWVEDASGATVLKMRVVVDTNDPGKANIC